MYNFFLQRRFTEHQDYPKGISIPDESFEEIPNSILFRNNSECLCVEIRPNKTLHTSFYIGLDWIDAGKKQLIYVEPKLNRIGHQTNYLLMLFSALRHPEVMLHTKDLFEIKFDEPYAEIDQKDDLLTPLLIAQFLRVVQELVKKGLRKSYYKVEENLFGKIKGKLMVSQTIKNNTVKGRKLNSFCSYNEFGVDSFENRLIKNVLLFIQRYLPTIKDSQIEKLALGTLGYIMPAFEHVRDNVRPNESQHVKKNAFYREYDEAIRLGEIILKRFGYNISNTQKQIISTPPFWIDMSKLFELYVLGLLKDRFSNEITYHFTKSGNELDYLLNNTHYKMVVDAKYKMRYQEVKGFKNEDIRQVSGYSRLKSVYDELNVDYNSLIDCLIIYPDNEDGYQNLISIDLRKEEISQFSRVFKLGIRLPLLE